MKAEHGRPLAAFVAVVAATTAVMAASFQADDGPAPRAGSDRSRDDLGPAQAGSALPELLASPGLPPGAVTFPLPEGSDASPSSLGPDLLTGLSGLIPTLSTRLVREVSSAVPGSSGAAAPSDASSSTTPSSGTPAASSGPQGGAGGSETPAQAQPSGGAGGGGGGAETPTEPAPDTGSQPAAGGDPLPGAGSGDGGTGSAEPEPAPAPAAPEAPADDYFDEIPDGLPDPNPVGTDPVVPDSRPLSDPPAPASTPAPEPAPAEPAPAEPAPAGGEGSEAQDPLP